MRTSARRFLYRLKHDYLTFEHVIFAIAALLCLYWTWNAISSMTRNWELEQRVSQRRYEKERLELEVETLRLENEYYKSVEYQELAAREKQNKMLPGEHLVYLPENSPAAKEKYQQQDTVEYVEPSNFEQWMSFLFGA